MPKNTVYYVIDDEKQTIPASVIRTGTLSTVGETVIGDDDTLFETEMPAGSWLVDIDNNEVRYVHRVDSNKMAYILGAFSSDLSASSDVNVIAKVDMDAVAISVQVPTGMSDAEIDGETFYNGTCLTFGKESRDHSGKRDLIDPIVADATSTVIAVSILR